MTEIKGQLAYILGVHMCVLTKSQDLAEAKEEAQKIIVNHLEELILMSNRMMLYKDKELEEITN